MKVSQLKKNPNNPRQIKGEKLELLKKSIGSFQKMMELRPIVVDENNVVLGGNMRLAAIKVLGLKEIPDSWVKQADDLTEDEKREFVIKDNAGFGEWDWDLLANEWDASELTEWGLDVPDFEAIEPPGDADAEPQLDKAAELNKKWKVKSGDLWQIGLHRLICGDSTDAGCVSRLMTGERAQLILTSPPYGVGMEYEDGNGFDETVSLSTAVLLNACSQVKENGFAFVNFGDRWTFPKMMGQVYLEIFQSAGWRWYDFRFWKRSNVSMAIWNTTQPHAMSDAESCFTFQNGTGAYPVHDLEISKQSIWTDEGSSAGMHHPAVMASGVAEKALTIYTEANDAVYEPFAGSGTTLVACQNLNRKCYAIEISENYCAVILERMATAFPDLEIQRINSERGKSKAI